MRTCNKCGGHFESRYPKKWCNEPECQKARKAFNREYARKYQANYVRKLKASTPKTKGGYCKCGKPLNGNFRRCEACVIRDSDRAGRCDDNYLFLPDYPEELVAGGEEWSH